VLNPITPPIKFSCRSFKDEFKLGAEVENDTNLRSTFKLLLPGLALFTILRTHLLVRIPPRKTSMKERKGHCRRKSKELKQNALSAIDMGTFWLTMQIGELSPLRRLKT